MALNVNFLYKSFSLVAVDIEIWTLLIAVSFQTTTRASLTVKSVWILIQPSNGKYFSSRVC